MKIGDSVKFVKLLSEDHNDWEMDVMAFNYIRMLIGETAEILYVQTHYEDDGTKSYYLDVEFPSGYKLKSANSLAFELEQEQ